MSACPDCERLRETVGRPDVVCFHHDLIRIGQTFRDMPLSFADAHKQIDTLRQRAERAEADLREYRNLCEVLMEGNRCSIKLASDLLVAESTIAELNATVERMRLLLLVLLRGASCKVLHENGDAHHAEGLCPAIERFRAALGDP